MPSPRPRRSYKSDKVKKLLVLGDLTPAMIAAKVKCNLSYVYRIMHSQGIDPKDWKKTTADTVAPVPIPVPFYGSTPPEAAHAASEIEDYRRSANDQHELVMNCIYAAAIVVVLITVLFLVS